MTFCHKTLENSCCLCFYLIKHFKFIQKKWKASEVLHKCETLVFIINYMHITHLVHHTRLITCNKHSCGCILIWKSKKAIVILDIGSMKKPTGHRQFMELPLCMFICARMCVYVCWWGCMHVCVYTSHRHVSVIECRYACLFVHTFSTMIATSAICFSIPMHWLPKWTAHLLQESPTRMCTPTTGPWAGHESLFFISSAEKLKNIWFRQNHNCPVHVKNYRPDDAS